MKQLTYISILIWCVLLYACRGVEYIPVETVKEKIEYRDRLQRDSIHILDSVFMQVRGDTVFRDKWRTVYKDRLVRDTAYIHETDSVRVPYPVEKKLTGWQQLKIELGSWAFGGLLITLFISGWLVFRSRNK